MSDFPFVVKPKTSGSRPRIPICTALAPVCQFPRYKSPLDIKFPWSESKAKQLPNTPTSEFIAQCMLEYAEAHPSQPSGNHRDVMAWLYNRAVDAESEAALLNREVENLETSVGSLKDEIRGLEQTIRIMESGINV